jgi:protein TonB
LARNKRYPTDALAGGIGGTASVSFTVGPDGQVASLRLARSSGNASLDRESLDLVRRTSPFPPPPHGKASITVPVNFSVRTGR